MEEYPKTKYFNYYPIPFDEENEKKPSDFPHPQNRKDKVQSVWDLKNPEIGFGLRLTNSNMFMEYELKKHEEVTICYGERANSYLLIEYGFAIPNNKFDFVRVNDVTLKSFGLENAKLKSILKQKFNLKDRL
jgi:hypothetical protein